MLRKLPRALQEEAVEKIESFKYLDSHAALRVHKLHGELRGCYSFSVNYRYRIIFEWAEKGETAMLLAIGDHALYD